MRNLIVTPFVYLLLQMAAVGASLRGSGGFAPTPTPDTAGYVDFPFSSLSDALGYYRTPGYPLFLRAVGIISPEYALAPVAHYVLWCAAVVVFWQGLRPIIREPWSRLAAASSLLYANILHGYVHFIATDTLAAAAALTGVGLVMGRSVTSRRFPATVCLGLATAAAWLIRPVYMFLTLLIPLFGAFLSLINRFDEPRANNWKRETAGLLLLTIGPVLVYCGCRWIVIGRFGVVSFGGYNLVGIAGQFLVDEQLPRLPANLRPVAELALQNVKRGDDRIRDYADLDRFNYTRMENYYDSMIWTVYAPAAKQVLKADNPEINAELSRLGLAIIEDRPLWYATWLAKASRQAVRKLLSDLVANPVYLLLVLATAAAQVAVSLVRGVRHKTALASAGGCNAIEFLFIVAFLYAVMNLLLVIAVCPPLGRMTDAAALFFPVVLAAALADRLQLLKGRCAYP